MMVASIFMTDKVHLVDRATLWTTIMFVGLVQRDPNGIVGLGGVA